MTNYRLTDEQRRLKQAARDFAQEELLPIATRVERAGEPLPREALALMAERGFMGLDIPEAYGGLGLDTLTCAIILEEISAVWFSAGTYPVTLLTGPLLFAGTEEQQNKYLPKVASGELITAFALTETDAGSDAASIQTFAERDGDDWVINGRKIYITNGGRADLIVLFARTEKDAPRGGGISLFLIEQGTPGFSVGQTYETIAHTANPIAELVFDDCRVPNSCLMGAPGEGFRYIQVGFAKTRAIYGARCAGVAQGALDYALSYMQTREQFGQPLSSFQALRFRAAELAARIEAGRQLSYHAAVLAEDETDDAPTAASMAKMVASDVCTEVTQQAVQFLGGHGLTKDHPVERFYRETKLFQIGDGSSEMLRLLVSRHLNRQSQAGMSARLASD
ncbi:MAG: acyl-CoA dehydrogenase family protein [Rhodospirillaceae bacterium]|jgi:alkylation response protein AidB-like acyl-CoA dehydrogenase|nr:acyl-CoA dehydrogenase family protein [Rhodospirillaceae bacterium]